MTHFRVLTLRALALSLALAAACPAQAQTTPTAGPAAARQPDAAAVARADEQRKQVAVALGKSDELASAGKFDADIALLEDAEKKIPGDALIASALGTAFESKGQLGDALDWIREGIKRDAGAHKGSEWLHARILEAKLALAKDPKWFDKHNVLGLDFGKDEVPVAPEILPIEQGRIKGAEQLLDQIDYQLVERTKNSRPPNPVLGDLFASAGDLAIASAVSPLDDRKSKIQPEKYYERALEFGAPHGDLVRKRLDRYKADFAALPPAPKDAEPVADYPPVNKRFEAPPETSYSAWIYVGSAAGVIVVVLAIAAVLDRRRRKHAEANPPPPLPDV